MDLASAQVLSLRLLPRLLRHAQRNGWSRPRPVTPEELAQFQVVVALFIVTSGLGQGARLVTTRTDNVPRPEPRIFSTLRSLDKQMDMYEDQELQDLARQEIPIQRLKAEATALQQSDSPLPCEDDALAQVLVQWFKNEYFKWADPIKCPKCAGKTEMTEMVSPNEYERAGGAGRVEMHVCTSENGPCDGNFRFARFKYVGLTIPDHELTGYFLKRPKDVAASGQTCTPSFSVQSGSAHVTVRYPHPTQSPRLPPYLNNIPRAVWNAEDHVWNEYFSSAAGRWLHTDSCEAARDEPLLYDRGWGKKVRAITKNKKDDADRSVRVGQMSYVVAFSVDGATDVSRGYVQDSAEMFKRRRLAPEGALAQELAQITAARRRNLTQTKKAQLEVEDGVERAWLAASDQRAKQPKEEPSRISGTREWKEARGEAGPSMSSDDASEPKPN
ncbi:peptide-N4-(N-acetyl-beta- glucosaminyl)asparagine amidase [Ceratobasidium sp. 414]|nr:peptide-N4-(N-acetyl-beta- glucosaminyl)asparagine amidase [Ceratobasidium sp. 414]